MPTYEEEVQRSLLSLEEERKEREEAENLKRQIIEIQKLFEKEESERISLENNIKKIPKVTYPEITIIKEALKENDNKLNTIRYDSLTTQDKINDLTKRLNKVNYSISTIKSKNKPNYSASGELTFF